MREFGQFNFSANLEVKKTAPLDARVVVATKAELINSVTWTDGDGKVWLYNGLVVAALDVQGLFMLVDADNYTSESAWLEVDASAASIEVVNDLTSESTTAALAAAQGKVLNEKIEAVKASIVSAYVFKGSVATFEELPNEGLSAGDVYNVEAANGNVPAGTNYAWTGTTWDALAGSVDLSVYSTTTQVEEKITEAVNAAKSELTASISGNTASITSLSETVAANKTELQANIDGNTERIADVEASLNADTEGSVAYIVNNLSAVVGDAESGLVKDVEDLKSGQSALQAAVGTIQTDWKVKDVDTTAVSGIALTLTDNKVGVSVDATALNAIIEHPTITGSNTNVGVAITGGVEVGAEQTISAALQALSDNIATTAAGGITSITSTDNTINVEGTGNARALTVNVSNLVADESAISVVDNKLDLIWIEA